MSRYKYDFGVSYSTKDIELVDYFVKTLTNKYNLNIFFDKNEQNEFIGRNISDKLESKYNNCQFVLFFWTNNYLKTDWTQKEFEYIKTRSTLANLFGIGIILTDKGDDPFLKETHHLELNYINIENVIEAVANFFNSISMVINLYDLFSLITNEIFNSSVIKEFFSISLKKSKKENTLNFTNYKNQEIMSIKICNPNDSITIFFKTPQNNTFHIRCMFQKKGDSIYFINYSFISELENEYIVDDFKRMCELFIKTLSMELCFQERMIINGQ